MCCVECRKKQLSDDAKSLNIKGMQRKSHETGKIFSGLGVFQASDVS